VLVSLAPSPHPAESSALPSRQDESVTNGANLFWAPRALYSVHTAWAVLTFPAD